MEQGEHPVEKEILDNAKKRAELEKQLASPLIFTKEFYNKVVNNIVEDDKK